MNIPKFEDFQNNLNSKCRIEFSEDCHQECEITEVNQSAANDQFSVIFSQANPQIQPQGVYRVKHEALGTLDIFMVPVSGDDEAVNYEAVFT
ncbi:hypothetical protein OS175_11365 [Marinicella sp. S1101]|jgi:hypothetical protein|uniref:DUF6916 family protein n=1 Tax=Marinicella marina TaxID=2996016 RepID=UPI002260F1C0|nr:hypothetical protein [Marinicella marina]MCX7554483.1 hypothetical protein [Marinicella marina]MDJ1140634.1 hypothetical protein [Marinicella marina]